jgi:hypothetical protein
MNRTPTEAALLDSVFEKSAPVLRDASRLRRASLLLVRRTAELELRRHAFTAANDQLAKSMGVK